MEQGNGILLMAVDCVKTDSAKVKKAIFSATALSAQMGLKPQAVTIISPRLFNWPFDFQEGMEAAFMNFGEDVLLGLVKDGRPQTSFPSEVIYQKQASRKGSVQSLIKAANEKGASMIAVFTHALKDRDISMPGSFISTLIYQSSVPVLIVNADSTDVPHVQTLLVATDFSPDSEKTMKETVSWAAKLKARIVLVHILPVVPRETMMASAVMMAGGGWANVEGYLKDEQARLTQKGSSQVAAIKAAGVDARFELLNGTLGVAKAILETATQVKADLLVLTEKTGPWMTVLLGSITRQVLSDSKLPVLVMTAPSEKH